MNRTMLALTMVLLLAMGAVQGFSQGTPPQHAKVASPSHAIYTCPMHSDVVSDKPGKCPKCGMTLVMNHEQSNADKGLQSESENSPTLGKIQRAKSMLAESKRELAQDGKYNCCIKDPCDRCALDHQTCSCADNVKDGKTVCPDCYAGWQRGDGIVKGVDAKKVKGGFHSHKH